jgi:hypothetical protein
MISSEKNKNSRHDLYDLHLPLQQENVVAFRIMKHGPFLMALDEKLLANGVDRRLEVRNLKK